MPGTYSRDGTKMVPHIPSPDHGVTSMMENHVVKPSQATSSVPISSTQPPAKTRKKKAPTLRSSDWAPYRNRITELYSSGLLLKEVKEIVGAETGFYAELRQYKSRISQWGLDKNVKPEEMKCIVRKRQKRRLVEVDKPNLVFQVRGNAVDEAKINRWMNTHAVSDSMLYAPSSAASTPSAVGCHTISERGSPAPIDSESRSLPVTKNGQGDYSLRRAYDVVWSSWVRVICHAWSSPSLAEEFDRCKHETSEFVRTYGPPEDIIDVDYPPTNLLYIPTMYGAYENPRLLKYIIQYWLETGHTLEGPTLWGMTPLLFAAQLILNRPSKYMSLLIEYGADVHAVDSNGCGALHMVTWMLRTYNRQDFGRVFNNEAEARLVILLEAGCNANAVDHTGRTPWQYLQRGGKAWDIWTTALVRSKGHRISLDSEPRVGLE